MRVNHRFFLRAPLLGIVTFALVLAACGGDEAPAPKPVIVKETVVVVATAQPGPTAAPVSKTGGTVIMATEHPQAMVPVLAGNIVDEYAMGLIYNALTRPDPITLDPTPDLAESWETSADGMTWTFKLRPGVKWSDGKDLAADDVKFSWENLCNPDIPGNADPCQQGFQYIEGAEAYIAGEASGISGITVVDPLTVQVKMTQIYAPLLNLMTVHFIIPKHALEGIPAAELGQHDYSLGKGTIGTGPFVMEFWTQNESLGVRAREDYHEGRANVDAFVIRWCLGGQRSTAFTQMKVGEINLMAFFCDLPHDFVAETESDPAVDFTSYQGINVFVVEYNMNTAPFGDKRVRQALSYATNRGAIGQGLYSGRWISHPHVTAPAFTRFNDPSITVPDNDPAKLAELLGEVGYTKDGDGLFRDSAGDSLNFELSHYPSAFQFGPALSAQWREAGIDVKVQGYEWAAFFFPIYLEGKHGALAQGNESADFNAITPWLAFTSTADINGWSNAQEYKDLIAGINSTLDAATQERNYKALQKLMAEDQYVLFTGWPDTLWGRSSKLVMPESSIPKAQIRYVKDFYFEK